MNDTPRIARAVGTISGMRPPGNHAPHPDLIWQPDLETGGYLLTISGPQRGPVTPNVTPTFNWLQRDRSGRHATKNPAICGALSLRWVVRVPPETPLWCRLSESN